MNYTEYKSDNLTYLTQAYFAQSTAKLADETISKHSQATSRELAHLLRDHRHGVPISDEETYQRDSMDFLLAYYSILEIASLIQFVPTPVPADLKKGALRNLSHPAVVRYYDQFYPIMLPKLFRMRLEGSHHLVEGARSDHESTHQLFNEFLGLVNFQRNDEFVETFLWFLDDGWQGGYNIGDTLAVLEDPVKLVEHLAKPPAVRDALDKSLLGFQRFWMFCTDLDGLLTRCQKYGLLQSELWYYFAYWFEVIRDKIERQVSAAAKSISEWARMAGKEADRQQVSETIDVSITEIQGTFGRLLSGDYGRALRQAMVKRNVDTRDSGKRIEEWGSGRSREMVGAGAKRTKAKALTKSDVERVLAAATGLSRAQVGEVFAALEAVIKRELGKKGPGLFTVPGLLKLRLVKKPATRARKGINPFTKQETLIKAKPARNVVRALPLKALNDLVK